MVGCENEFLYEFFSVEKDKVPVRIGFCVPSCYETLFIVFELICSLFSERKVFDMQIMRP